MTKHEKKQPILKKLRTTLLCLCAAIVCLWLLLFAYMNTIVKNNSMSNLEQVSLSVVNELDQFFLKIKELSFSMNEKESVNAFLSEKDSIKFYEKAKLVSREIDQKNGNETRLNNIIMFNNHGKYYRFAGKMSNTASHKIFVELQKKQASEHVQISVEGISYIGYVDNITFQRKNIGKIVVLIDESELYRIIKEDDSQKGMLIGLGADHRLVVCNDKSWVGKSTSMLNESTQYLVHAQIEFTPFELFVVYKDANKDLSILLIVALVGTAVALGIAINAFVSFWKNKFFVPITGIVEETESLTGEKGEQITLTGMEHFDGLVSGINEMIARIEEKDEQLFSTAMELKEEEIKSQKALIVSLKKQISAHFTVNVLTEIKALAEEGDVQQAGFMCDGLATLLRYAHSAEEYISLMDEFFVLDKYIGLMQIRYPGRFVAEIDIEDYFDEVFIPRMLIQPIVENSILHGYDRDCELIQVKAECMDEEGALNITITDNGRGMDEEQLCDNGTEKAGLKNIALHNIQQRIRSYYGEPYGMTIKSKKGEGTCVTLFLPIQK